MIRGFFSKTIWLLVNKVPWKPILIWGPWILILLVVSFYGIENWRGAKAWKQAQLLAKETGVSLDFRDHFPTPSEEKLKSSTLPLLDGVKADSFKLRIYRGEKGFNTKTAAREGTTRKNRWKAQPRDIRLWLDPAAGPFTPQEAATELRRIAKADLDRLHALVNLSKENSILLEPTSPNTTFQELSKSSVLHLLNTCEFADADTLFALAEKDSEQAFENLRLMLTLIKSEAYPSLLNWLISASSILIIEHILWESIMSDVLTDTQLASLDNQLSSINLSEKITPLLEAELAFTLEYFDEFENDKKAFAESLAMWTNLGLFSTFGTGWTPFDEACESIDIFLLARMPHGWLDLTKAELITQTLVMREKFQAGSFSEVEAYEPEKEPGSFPTKLYSNEITSIIKKGITKGINSETRLRLARIGIALEQHQRKHGHYPSSLAELKNLPQLSLLDPFSNQNFGYRLKVDQTPFVWSVGENKVDEDGLPGLRPKEGDIVWQITPIPGLTEADLRKKLRKHCID